MDMKLKKSYIALVFAAACIFAMTFAAGEIKAVSIGTVKGTDGKTTRNISLDNGDAAAETFDFDDTDATYFSIGETGKILPDYDEYVDYVLTATYTSSDPKVVKVNSKGEYTVLGAGVSVVSVVGKDTYGNAIFNASYRFRCLADTQKFKVEEKSLELYGFEGGGGSATTYLTVKNISDLTYCHVTAYTSNGIGVESVLDRGNKKIKLTFDASESGNFDVTVSLNGVTATVPVTITMVKINKTSLLLAKGKTSKLKLTGCNQTLTWKSTKPKVVKVSKKGKVTAKKVGNAVVYTKINDQCVGCAISVVKAALKKVVKKGRKIYETCKYSQPLRMSAKYYDCSSLVWRCYKTMNKYFGDKSYAPVAATIAKYCITRNKKIKGGSSAKNIQSMVLRPGDLLFKTGAKNGRYKGIYHVEMFYGYNCRGFDGETPILGSLWCARSENYAEKSYLMVRP